MDFKVLTLRVTIPTLYPEQKFVSEVCGAGIEFTRAFGFHS